MRRPTLPATAAIAALLAIPGAGLARQADQDYAVPAPATSPPLDPVEPGPLPQLRRSAVVESVRGRVTFRRRGSRRVERLSRRVRIPMGSLIDTRFGRVRVIVARDRSRRLDSAIFYDGRFRISQGRGKRPVTTLRMVGGDFQEACAARARASAKRRTRRVRRLWGSGKGRFRTRGRYSAATVRGTRWLVEDRCEGTVTRVASGVVEVVDYVATEPAPRPPESGGGGGTGGGTTGGGEDGVAPQAAPAPPARERARPRRVRVRKGGSYIARPAR